MIFYYCQIYIYSYSIYITIQLTVGENISSPITDLYMGARVALKGGFNQGYFFDERNKIHSPVIQFILVYEKLFLVHLCIPLHPRIKMGTDSS